MSYVIAVTGKGGTGKTTIAALIVRLIKEKGLGSVLAVDADPNANLGEALGIGIKETIGSIVDRVASNPDKIPAGMSKDRFIEYEVGLAVAEGDGFDLLSMGRPEGPGCYCYVNNVLRNVADKLIKDYKYVVIDNEAGLEHLSRRTTRQCDTLLVVSDATRVGLKSANRIFELVKELKIKTKKNLLVINRSGSGEAEAAARDSGIEGLEYSGNIPADGAITQIAKDSGSLWELNDASASIVSLCKIGEKIWRLN